MDPTCCSNLHDQNHFDGWIAPPNLSCIALMALCFVSVLCINRGGTLGKCILWRVNEDYLDILYLEDPSVDETEKECYKQRKYHRTKERLYDTFVRAGCIQRIEEDDDKNKAMVKVRSTRDARISSSGACSICLEAYQQHDTLIWSLNQDCSHAFHQDCLLEFFARNTGKQGKIATPCPCCRRDFCSSRTGSRVGAVPWAR